MLKVQVISNETIKPSSPTPKHLHTVPLSMIDQCVPPIYVKIILFFSSGDGTDEIEKVGHLKKSLSETLTHFYPLAGRIRAGGNVHVECNDDGVEFSEARVEGDLDSVLQQPLVEEFNKLFPNNRTVAGYGDPLLEVQFNAFECGGTALGICISHQIADTSSMTMFLNSWAHIARGSRELISFSPPLCFDSASVFPPINALAPPNLENFISLGEVPKNFTIKGSAIDRLRRGNAAYARTQFPTRVEAVATLLWRCVVRAKAEAARKRIPAVVHVVVNLRKKMAGQLSDSSFGNLYTLVAVTGEGVGNVTERGRQALLEENMREAVRTASGDQVRKYVEQLISGQTLLEGEVAAKYAVSIFSSWCKFPLYETNFGWGKPAWLCVAMRDLKNWCILTDTKDGKGIDVWLWLEKDDMDRFERDPEVLEFFTN